jgi:hypothetical protein
VAQAAPVHLGATTEFAPIPGHHTPNLGRAWYTGFRGEPPGGPFQVLKELGEETMTAISRHLVAAPRLWQRLQEAQASAA